MIINKNFDMKIKIDSDIVSKYFEECLKDSKELSEITNKLNDNILSYMCSFYLRKLKETDIDKYNLMLSYHPQENIKPLEEKTINIFENVYVGQIIIFTKSPLTNSLFNNFKWVCPDFYTGVIKQIKEDENKVIISIEGELYSIDKDDLLYNNGKDFIITTLFETHNF